MRWACGATRQELCKSAAVNAIRPHAGGYLEQCDFWLNVQRRNDYGPALAFPWSVGSDERARRLARLSLE